MRKKKRFGNILWELEVDEKEWHISVDKFDPHKTQAVDDWEEQDAN